MLSHLRKHFVMTRPEALNGAAGCASGYYAPRRFQEPFQESFQDVTAWAASAASYRSRAISASTGEGRSGSVTRSAPALASWSWKNPGARRYEATTTRPPTLTPPADSPAPAPPAASSRSMATASGTDGLAEAPYAGTIRLMRSARSCTASSSTLTAAFGLDEPAAARTIESLSVTPASRSRWS